MTSIIVMVIVLVMVIVHSYIDSSDGSYDPEGDRILSILGVKRRSE